MSYAYTPSSGSNTEHATWQRKNQANTGSVTDKINNILSGGGHDGLPMYKDKPYNYAPSGKKLPFFRRQRLVLALLGAVALFLFWTGPIFAAKDPAAKNASKSSGGIFKWLSGGAPKMTIWDERRERVKDAFRISWKAYEEHAWGYDIFHPATKKAEQMIENGLGWIIIDALDTMMLMNLTTELSHARDWVATNLTFNTDHDVNTFETTIRMLGGLLSAHYLSTQFPNMAPLPPLGIAAGEDLYLEKATDLADRLLGAYESASGVPFASINLKTGKGIVSHDDGGASSTAEATSLQLEMKYLAKLTGETHYWEAAEKVMQVVDDNGMKDGLVPIYIYADQGVFRGDNIRLGSRGDSYYEYLIKQYLQTSGQEPIYHDMWSQALTGVRKHLLAYTEHSNLTILAERPSGLGGSLFPKMDHLVCFMPGTIALAATGGHTLAHAKAQPTWTADHDAQIALAHELTKTCWGMYKISKTGLSPEIAHFHVDNPAVLVASEATPRPSPEELSDDPDAAWRKDFDVHSGDRHNLQRPETVESLFYMWRITGDSKYREWGWEMFEAFEKWTLLEEVERDADGNEIKQYSDDEDEESVRAKAAARVPLDMGKKYRGFSSVSDVDRIPPPTRDNMESFWLAETLKYFYLLFSDSDILPLTDIVLNTEAHPFPKFELGKLFKTGWTRRPRDANGNMLNIKREETAPAPPVETKAVEVEMEKVVDEVREAQREVLGSEG